VLNIGRGGLPVRLASLIYYDWWMDKKVLQISMGQARSIDKPRRRNSYEFLASIV